MYSEKRNGFYMSSHRVFLHLLVSHCFYPCYPRMTEVCKFSSVCNIAFIALPHKPDAAKQFWALASIFSTITTIAATCMIALKVIAGTVNGPTSSSYPKPIEIFVQSAGLQSLVLLVDAIVSLVIAIERAQFGSNTDAILTQMSAYTFTCSRAAMVNLSLYILRVTYLIHVTI